VARTAFGVMLSAAGSLRWLFERYRDSGAWNVLSVATRRQRENIMKHVLDTGGAVQAHGIIDRPSEDVDLFTAWERRDEWALPVAARSATALWRNARSTP